VLIHGFGLDTRMWGGQYNGLTERYRVIRYDVRGFGRSALPTGENFSHPDDLKALLEHLSITHAHILGLSYGGNIAAGFAMAYPKETDALILVDSILGGFRWGGFGRPLAKVWATGRQSGVQAGREAWLALDLFSLALEKPDVAACLREMVATYSGWHWVNSIRAPDYGLMQRMGVIIAPTLVVAGEHDLPDFHKIADTFATRIPGAKKLVMPGVGHMAPMEDSRQFNEMILNFLAKSSLTL
jgi:pimeloyl-ACP methyl ester carboxylesterase